MKNELEQDLEVDPTQLDLQAAMQAELFFKWAERAVNAKKKFDKSKFTLDVTGARLSGEARIDPDSFGIAKLTEAGIEAAVKSHPDYVEAYENMLKAKASSSMIDKGTEAMEQKKRMIEVLITLHGQQYFAGPSVPRNLVAAWQEEKEARGKRIQEKQKKTLRRRKE